MMDLPFLYGGFALFVVLRPIFGMMALIGIVLLVAWAIKHLPAQKAKNLGLWLLAVGVVGTILMVTLPLFAGMHGSWKMMGGDGRYRGGMMKQWNMPNR